MLAKRNSISNMGVAGSHSALSDPTKWKKKKKLLHITAIIILLTENISDCFCFRSCIFYRACVDIPRGTELLVWYNDSYTSFFGIPLQCVAQDENCKFLLLFLNVLDIRCGVSDWSSYQTDLHLISLGFRVK